MSQLQPINIPVHTKQLGASLIAYILNIDVSDAKNLLQHGGEISAKKQQVLELAEQLLIQAKSARIQNQALDWSDHMQLREMKFQDGTSVLNGLRQQAGGDEPTYNTHDPVKAALADMCIDCFPVTLLPELHENFGRIGLPHFHGSYKLANFLEAIRNDKEVMKLFPEGGNNEYACSYHYTSSLGRGGAVQLVLLHDFLIQSGIALMHAKNQSSTIDLQLATWEMIDTLRDSISKKKSCVLVFDIFDLVGLPEGFELKLDNSNLMGIPRKFIQHIPPRARREKVGTGFSHKAER